MSSRGWSLAAGRRHVLRVRVRQARIPRRVHQDTVLREVDKEHHGERRGRAAFIISPGTLEYVDINRVNIYSTVVNICTSRRVGFNICCNCSR